MEAILELATLEEMPAWRKKFPNRWRLLEAQALEWALEVVNDALPSEAPVER